MLHIKHAAPKQKKMFICSWTSLHVQCA